MEIETHPFEPWLPANARLLMLGTFPPAPHRWCMPWYYPNFQNDMWRIFGICFFGDKLHFVDEAHKTYRLEALKAFLKEKGVAIFDTALRIRRTKTTPPTKTSISWSRPILTACCAVCLNAGPYWLPGSWPPRCLPTTTASRPKASRWAAMWSSASKGAHCVSTVCPAAAVPILWLWRKRRNITIACLKTYFSHHVSARAFHWWAMRRHLHCDNSLTQLIWMTKSLS